MTNLKKYCTIFHKHTDIATLFSRPSRHALDVFFLMLREYLKYRIS